MPDNKGVLVYTEIAEGKLSAIATEALGAGRKLAADLGGGHRVVTVQCDSGLKYLAGGLYA